MIIIVQMRFLLARSTTTATTKKLCWEKGEISCGEEAEQCDRALCCLADTTRPNKTAIIKITTRNSEGYGCLNFLIFWTFMFLR